MASANELRLQSAEEDLSSARKTYEKEEKWAQSAYESEDPSEDFDMWIAQGNAPGFQAANHRLQIAKAVVERIKRE
ncbi:hypothetical protein PT974_02254 [Cladobotryum mycophilum]|uniref:Clathrin light chain n=1 Tax=Cladobotryum mycophilum TaxID=491253 RepID=A0ABR0SXS3_9HYPO